MRREHEPERMFDENGSEGYFGTKLDSEAPIIMCDCISFIRHRGLQEVGIFRIPGNNDIVIDLKKKYNEAFASKKSKSSNETSVLNQLHPPPNVSDVASLLKAFFKELSESLIPPPIATEMVTAIRAKEGDAEDLAFYLSRAMKKIPSPNRECLSFLVSFWREICVFKKYNNMGPDNLSTCFVLSVMGKGNSSTQLQALGNGAAVIQALISLPVKLFMPQISVVQNNTKYRDTQYATHMKISELQRQYKDTFRRSDIKKTGTLRKLKKKMSQNPDSISNSKLMKKKGKKGNKGKGKKTGDFNYKPNGTRIMQKPLLLSEVVVDGGNKEDTTFDLANYTDKKLNTNLPPPPFYEKPAKKKPVLPRYSEELPPPPPPLDEDEHY